MQTGPVMRRLALLAAVLVLPKCLACAASYLALATGILAIGPEICGDAAPVRAGWAGPLIGLAGLAAATLAFRRKGGVRNEQRGSLIE
jgi:hypothetical protein